MKFVLGGISIVGIILVFLFCPLAQSSAKDCHYLRIHIRANSNLDIDQEVKYKVKDGVVDALIPLLAEVETFDEALEYLAK